MIWNYILEYIDITLCDIIHDVVSEISIICVNIMIGTELWMVLRLKKNNLNKNNVWD